MINLVKNILSVFAKHGLFDEGVTLIGSWCFQLYQKHFYVAKFPLQTQDIDFLKAALSSTGMPVGIYGERVPREFLEPFDSLCSLRVSPSEVSCI